MKHHLHYAYPPLDGETLHYVANPQAGADAWVQGAGAATGKWATNLQNTQKDIVGRAVAAAPQAVANYNDAINSGRWAARLQAVGNAGIKAAAQAKAANFGTGVSQARDKYLAAAQKLYPYIAQGQAQIEAMPSGSIAASKARATAWIDYMHAGKGSF
jgi:hypothetical protein